MRTIFFSILVLSSGLYSAPFIPDTPFEKKIDLEPHEDELVAIERMILLTEQQQIAQKKLKILLTALRKNKELFLKEGNSRVHARYMLDAAEESLKLIRTYHLDHLFSSDFMEELALFAQVGKKEYD